MSILLVWDENPEIIKFYVGEVGSTFHRLCIESNGKYINGSELDDSDSIFALDKLLQDMTPEVLPILKHTFTEVYQCGFIL